MNEAASSGSDEPNGSEESAAPDRTMLWRFLDQIPVAAVRMTLGMDAAQVDVPRLRGVWGAALHALSPTAYGALYKPTEDAASGRDELPGYVVRRALQAPDDARPALELLLLGRSVQFFDVALRAWDMAAGMGVGAERVPFPLVERWSVSLSGFPCVWGSVQRLSLVADYVSTDDERLECELRLETPLSLMRDGQLVTQPTLVDVVAKTCRRIENYLPEELREAWYTWRGRLIEDARARPAVTRVRRPDRLHRYSARQKRDFYVPGVTGSITLPQGAGPLLPLLLTLPWLHVGKCCNVGQGHITVRFPDST